MEDFRKRQLNDRPAALEAKYDPEEEAKTQIGGGLADVEVVKGTEGEVPIWRNRVNKELKNNYKNIFKH